MTNRVNMTRVLWFIKLRFCVEVIKGNENHICLKLFHVQLSMLLTMWWLGGWAVGGRDGWWGWAQAWHGGGDSHYRLASKVPKTREPHKVK